ncbi:retrotransposon protein, putative, ty1-copia subclass [Tanacetum coccineum]
MHNTGKIIGELHALLFEYEKGLPKKDATPQVMAIQGCRIQKANKKLLNAKGKGKGWKRSVDSEIPMEVEGFEPPQEEVVPIRRILIAIAAFYDYEIWQMDVKTAFLNGYLDEDIYMVQPEGFVDPKHPRKVCKLQRSIYGLKQASRSWNKRFDEEIKKFGFAQNLDEPCVYQKASGSNVTFLILYVDDIIIMGNHIPSLQSVKSYLGKCFAMKDLGEATFILGIKIYRDRSKRLIRLRFETDRDDIKSQTGYIFILNRGVVDWKSSKQSTTAMFATKAEYIATSEAAMEVVWIKKFISGLGIVPIISEPIKMFTIIQPYFLLPTNQGFRGAPETTIEDTITFESASYWVKLIFLKFT